MLGIQTIVLAIGDGMNMMELRGLASHPYSWNLFTIDSWTGLSGILGDVINAHYNGKGVIGIALFVASSQNVK